MATETLREQIIRLNKAYSAGERTFLVDTLHENIDWLCYISAEALPIPNRVIGKWHVIEAWRKIDAELELVRNDILFLVAEEDRAAIIYDRALRQRKTNRVLRLKIGSFHRYQDNKLIESQEFGDGLELLEQTLGRSINAPSAYEPDPVLPKR